MSLIGSIVSYHLCAKYLGDVGFGEFATSKRLLALFYPVFTQVLATALAFHITKCGSRSDDGTHVSFLGSALALVVLVVLGIWLPILCFPAQLAVLALGSEQFEALLRSFPVVLLGTGLVAISSSYYVGRTNFLISSAITATASGLIPVLSLLAPNDDVADVFWKMGLQLAALGGFVLVYTFRGLAASRPTAATVKERFGLLCSYAVPRVPGSILLTAVVTLPVLFQARGPESMVTTGVLALGCTLVVLSQSLVHPIAWVLLPFITQAASAQNKRSLGTAAWKSVLGLTLILLPAITLACIFADVILRYWIGQGTERYAYILRWTLPAIFPFALFECLKSIIDGSTRVAYTTVISGVATLVFLGSHQALTILGFESPSLPALQLAALSLGLGAIYFTRKVINTVEES